jgi:hypothetical protein
MPANTIMHRAFHDLDAGLRVLPLCLLIGVGQGGGPSAAAT